MRYSKEGRGDVPFAPHHVEGHLLSALGVGVDLEHWMMACGPASPQALLGSESLRTANI